jgi:acetylglutamate kinase
MKHLTIIKIGGNILDNPELLSTTLDSFVNTPGYKLLIHGGGKIANVLMKKMGIEPKMVDGRRITDEQTLEIVTMVYGGLINKNLVCQLQSRGCNAIGLTGADANIIPALKRPVKDIDYGFVGDIDTLKINSDTLAIFINNDLTPVVAPLTHDDKGSLLNTNADTIASSVAIALSSHFKVRLVYCFEKKGVLSNPEDEESVISKINRKKFKEYKNKGAIHSGMIPKLETAFNALDAGVSEVFICGPDAFKKNDFHTGTLIEL